MLTLELRHDNDRLTPSTRLVLSIADGVFHLFSDPFMPLLPSPAGIGLNGGPVAVIERSNAHNFLLVRIS
jgi:hypothetical protein